MVANIPTLLNYMREHYCEMKMSLLLLLCVLFLVFLFLIFNSALSG